MKLKAARYRALGAELHWRNPYGLLLKCMMEEEAGFLVKDVINRGETACTFTIWVVNELLRW